MPGFWASNMSITFSVRIARSGEPHQAIFNWTPAPVLELPPPPPTLPPPAPTLPPRPATPEPPDPPGPPVVLLGLSFPLQATKASATKTPSAFFDAHVVIGAHRIDEGPRPVNPPVPEIM